MLENKRASSPYRALENAAEPDHTRGGAMLFFALMTDDLDGGRSRGGALFRVPSMPSPSRSRIHATRPARPCASLTKSRSTVSAAWPPSRLPIEPARAAPALPPAHLPLPLSRC